MIEAHIIEQRIEQLPGQKPTATVKRANYVNGQLTRSVKIFNGTRWINPAVKTRKHPKKAKAKRKTRKH